MSSLPPASLPEEEEEERLHSGQDVLAEAEEAH